MATIKNKNGEAYDIDPGMFVVFDYDPLLSDIPARCVGNIKQIGWFYFTFSGSEKRKGISEHVTNKKYLKTRVNDIIILE